MLRTPLNELVAMFCEGYLYLEPSLPREFPGVLAVEFVQVALRKVPDDTTLQLSVLDDNYYVRR